VGVNQGDRETGVFRAKEQQRCKLSICSSPRQRALFCEQVLKMRGATDIATPAHGGMHPLVGEVGTLVSALIVRGRRLTS